MLENYKIRVNNEAESKEAQELFFELGYEWADTKCQTPMKFTTSCIYSGFEDGELCRDYYDENPNHQELTLPQLRDLVVLKRNDVSDANYKSATDFYYVTVENQYYFWNGFAWCLSDAVFIVGLSPIIDNPENKEPALISGADALRALADGKEVEGFSEENEEWIPIVYFSVQEVVNGLYKFRLKPQTIKIEVEIPKPLESSVYGDKVSILFKNNDDAIKAHHAIKGAIK